MKPIELFQRKKELKTLLVPLSVQKHKLTIKLESVKSEFNLLHEEFKAIDKELFILLKKHKVVTARRMARTVKETGPIPPTYDEIVSKARTMKIEDRERLLLQLQGI